MDDVLCGINKEEIKAVRLYGAKNQKVRLILTVIPKTNLENTKIFITNLVNEAGGEVISRDNIDIRYVLGWYREEAANKTIHHIEGAKDKRFFYDLLANDSSLFVSNHKEKLTKIKVYNAGEGSFGYIVVNKLNLLGKLERDGRIKFNKSQLDIRDFNYLGDVDLVKKKPLIILVEIASDGVNPGLYSGKIIFSSNKTETKEVDILHKVEDIHLNESKLDYCVYYRGKLREGEVTFSSEYKSINQLRVELNNIREAGFNCVVSYQRASQKQNFNVFYSILSQEGFDKYVMIDSELITFMKKNDIRGYSRRLEEYRKAVDGNVDLLLYMRDEPTKEINRSLVPFRQIARENGFVSVTAGRFERIKNRVTEGSIYVVAYQPKEAVSKYFHSEKAKVFSYANPQVGLISPLLYRLNYGFILHKHGYDGAMLYAYQDSRGNQWDDSDGRYRDHMFSYSISEGIIETLSWIGMKEAIIDSRYITTRNNLFAELRTTCGTSLPPISIDESHKGTSFSNLDEYRESIMGQILLLSKALDSCDP